MEITSMLASLLAAGSPGSIPVEMYRPLPLLDMTLQAWISAADPSTPNCTRESGRLVTSGRSTPLGMLRSSPPGASRSIRKCGALGLRFCGCGGHPLRTGKKGGFTMYVADGHSSVYAIAVD